MEFIAPVLFVITVLAAVVFALARRRGSAVDVPPKNPDPLFLMGISLAGAGAALVATLGPGMIGVGVVGIVFIAVGARRSRHQQR